MITVHIFLTFLPSYHGYSFVPQVTCGRLWKLFDACCHSNCLPHFKHSTLILIFETFSTFNCWLLCACRKHQPMLLISQHGGHQYNSASLWGSAATGAAGTESLLSVLLNSSLENLPHFECVKLDVCCLPASSSLTSSVCLWPQIKRSRQQSNNTECCPPSGMKGITTESRELGFASDSHKRWFRD